MQETVQETDYSYNAQRFAGSHGTAWALSCIPKSVKLMGDEVYDDISFPFYALSVNTNEDNANIWIKRKKYKIESKKLVNKVERDGVNFLEKQSNEIATGIKAFSQDVYSFSEDLSTLSKQSLVKKFESFVQDYTNLLSKGVVTFMYESILSDELSELIKNNTDKKPAEALSRLLDTEYQSFLSKSDQKLLDIKTADSLQKKKKLANEYKKEFYFIKSGYTKAPKLTESKILQEAQDLQVEKDNKGEQPQESSSLQAGINLSKRGQIIASILRITEKLRDRRKHANLIGSYGMWQFLDEVQRRTNIDRSMTKRAFYFEFQKLLENPQQTLKLLRERDSVSMVYDGSDLYYYQEMTIKESKKISDSKKTIEGTPASPGIAKGEARAVLSPDDFEKFNKGDILVTEMTKPEYMPVIKKADAILAKEGGLTSHAAIISRELKIPCIVGLDRLSTQLGDGDRVEVDADEGVVKKIG